MLRTQKPKRTERNKNKKTFLRKGLSAFWWGGYLQAF